MPPTKPTICISPPHSTPGSGRGHIWPSRIRPRLVEASVSIELMMRLVSMGTRPKLRDTLISRRQSCYVITPLLGTCSRRDSTRWLGLSRRRRRLITETPIRSMGANRSIGFFTCYAVVAAGGSDMSASSERGPISRVGTQQFLSVAACRGCCVVCFVLARLSRAANGLMPRMG